MSNVLEILYASGLAWDMMADGASEEELEEIAEMIYFGTGIEF